MPYKWPNSYLDSLLLSVFTGMFGFDRFYLGYYGIGLLKVSTSGGFFIDQLVVIILIAYQIVRTADGFYYITAYYGAVFEIIRRDNETYRVSKNDL
uniref:TM2 domain-containing protein n=1 Tax=Glossina palpalis gambiensis TaxID=67801 RepID=A0A1B0BLG4_9MUSC